MDNDARVRELMKRKADLLLELGEVEWALINAKKDSLTENYTDFEKENFD